MLRALPVILGAIAIAFTITTLILNISFATVLTKADSTFPMGILALASSFLGGMGLIFLGLLEFQHILDWNHSQTTSATQWRWRVLRPTAFLLLVTANITTIGTLIWMHGREEDLPLTTLGGPIKSVLVAAFVFWAGACLAQAAFLALHSNGTGEQTQLPHTQPDRNVREMEDNFQRDPTKPNSRGEFSFESPASTVSSRKRSGSDTINSVRSSFSQIVRPTSSKTRPVPHKIIIQAFTPSGVSGERDTTADGFDSWDTSALDLHSWQTVMTSSNSSPTHGRALETIPASPTPSRSPSPGYPLDLRPPQIRRSRSYSPANSHREKGRREKPTSSHGSEAHIHPLFRSDSPSPAPSATPTTIITAAPGAGQVISDVRSVRRMRSGSLPAGSSPLVNSNSSDDPEQESREPGRNGGGRLSPVEREMTPPIPDWVLGAGSRNSLTGYTKRKESAGLNAVGEER